MGVSAGGFSAEAVAHISGSGRIIMPANTLPDSVVADGAAYMNAYFSASASIPGWLHRASFGKIKKRWSFGDGHTWLKVTASTEVSRSGCTYTYKTKTDYVRCDRRRR